MVQDLRQNPEDAVQGESPGRCHNDLDSAGASGSTTAQPSQWESHHDASSMSIGQPDENTTEPDAIERISHLISVAEDRFAPHVWAVQNAIEGLGDMLQTIRTLQDQSESVGCEMAGQGSMGSHVGTIKRSTIEMISENQDASVFTCSVLDGEIGAHPSPQAAELIENFKSKWVRIWTGYRDALDLQGASPSHAG